MTDNPNVKNPFAAAKANKGGQRKPINNPFGDVKVYNNPEEEFEEISYQQPAAPKNRVNNPYKASQPEQDELSGNIVINPEGPKRQKSYESQIGNNTRSDPFGKPKPQEPAQNSNQPYNPYNPYNQPQQPVYVDNNQQYYDNQSRYNQSTQPYPAEPEFVSSIKNASWFGTIMSGVSIFKGATPGSQAPPDDFDEENEPPLLEGELLIQWLIERFGHRY